jgi:hypothetical protein
MAAETKEMMMKTKVWILALTVLFTAGCNTGTTSTANAIVEDSAPVAVDETDVESIPSPLMVQKAGWYLRTTAKATLSDGTTLEHKTAGVFGELDESEEGKDRHDIASYGGAAFQVRFINEALGEDTQYYSDYRKYDGTDKKQVWTFVIINQKVDDTTPNLADANLKIEVEQMREVFKKEGDPFYIENLAKSTEDKRQQLTLVDVDNQKTYSYEALKTTTLSMGGLHTRTFRWVLGDVDQSDMEPLTAETEMSAASKSARSVEDEFAVSKTASTSTFGTPPE